MSFGDRVVRCGPESPVIDKPNRIVTMNASLATRAAVSCANANAASAAAGAFTPGEVSGGVAWAEMIGHRGYLVRFARRKLRDPLMAEDAVHDVFEAVLSGRAVFGSRSGLRTWLTAVLKHKIVDTVRRNAGTDSLDDAFEASESDGALSLECPQPGPAEIAEQQQLLMRVLVRIEALPAGLRDALRLRVLEDRSTDEVCRELGISEDNLFVRIHRARKQLLS